MQLSPLMEYEQNNLNKKPFISRPKWKTPVRYLSHPDEIIETTSDGVNLTGQAGGDEIGK